ncbi:MAG: ATP-binding protein [Planctomycetota bacterium]
MAKPHRDPIAPPHGDASALPAPPTRRRDVLHVVALDDDPGDLELLRRFLEEIPDLRLDFEGFTRAEEVLAAVSTRDPDIVFLDHLLGASTGLHLLSELRARGCERPVVLLTGQGSEDVAAQALRLGATDYLSKRSLSAETLGKTLRDAVEKWELREALGRYSRELEVTNRELQQRNAEIQRFYHTLSHQLKTPLTVAREFISLLLDGEDGALSDVQRDHLQIAKESCDELAVCVNDLLDISLLESGELRVRPAVTALEPLIERTVASFRPLGEARGIELAWICTPDLPEIFADPARVSQVLRNLLSNALKFTPDGGHVTVRAAREEGGEELVEVAVSDTGCGIAPETLERIFERLGHAGDEDGVTQKGLGMGLALCRELVRLSGGRLEVQSEPGRGSTFAFTIPTAGSRSARSAGTSV